MTPPGGTWLIYKHDSQGCKKPKGGVLINQSYPDWRSLIDFPRC